jgi:hypothetical protein
MREAGLATSNFHLWTFLSYPDAIASTTSKISPWLRAMQTSKSEVWYSDPNLLKLPEKGGKVFFLINLPTLESL